MATAVKSGLYHTHTGTGTDRSRFYSFVPLELTFILPGITPLLSEAIIVILLIETVSNV